MQCIAFFFMVLRAHLACVPMQMVDVGPLDGGELWGVESQSFAVDGRSRDGAAAG